MKRLIALTALVIGVSNGYSYQTTDYVCVSDCTAKGYLYNVCVSKCSTSADRETGTGGQVKTTDYTCVSDCTQKGYLYSVCVSKCSN